MKCVIPEISWHNRDPVLSVDIQPLLNNAYRLASGGGDCHVLIWLLKVLENGVIDIDAVSDLTRHQRAVNVVKWSNSGQYLASGDDDANIIVWHLKTDNIPLLDGNTNDKEVWVMLKVLRGHKEDVYDICWSPDDSKLLSGSIDNTAVIWDFSKGKMDKILTDHKGFVQGVSWDPKNEFISTASSDRICRVFDQTGKHLRSRIGRGLLPVPDSDPLFGKQVKYFHDDTFKSYFRRLKFSPDGSLLVVPAGCVETEDSKKALNATFMFSLDDLKNPVAVLPSGKQCSVCVCFCPLLLELQPDGPDAVIPLPYRMMFAVATDTDVIIYDTQQTKPVAYLKKIHYTRLTDLSWSKDGLILVASSTDGYCTIVNFEENELGVVYSPKGQVEDTIKEEEAQEKETEVMKRPTILDQWTIKTPKRNEIQNKTPQKINKLTPKRINPIQIEDLSKSPTVKKKATENTSTPKSKGSILNFVITKENLKENSTILDGDEAARDAWKCQNQQPEEASEFENSMEDFKLEISVSQTPDVEKQKIESVEDKNVEVPTEMVVPVEDKENEIKINETAQPPVKKPRRVELITLSSPRSKKKTI